MRFSSNFAHTAAKIGDRFASTGRDWAIVLRALQFMVAATAVLQLTPAWGQGYNSYYGGGYQQPGCNCPPNNSYRGSMGPWQGGSMAAPGGAPSNSMGPMNPMGPTNPMGTTNPGNPMNPMNPMGSQPSANMGDQAGQGSMNQGTGTNSNFDNTGANSNDLASSSSGFGSASGGGSGASGMIGDLISGLVGSDGNVSIAGGDLRSKIADNSSPRPTDRVFSNYNLFTKPVQAVDGRRVDLNRFQFGFEKTLLDDDCSIEVRIPFTSGLAANQFLSPVPDDRNVGFEFGNIMITPKFKLYDCCNLLISTGLEIQLPTAQNSSEFFAPLNATVLTFENYSTHLEPFLGALYNPCPKFFSIAYMQFDFDAGGITAIDHLSNEQWVIQQQTLLYLDINAGYWIYENPCACYVRGIATVVELHYTTTLQDADRPVGSPFDPAADTRGRDRRDLLDLTAGLDFKIGCNSLLTVATGVPLRSDDDRPFKSEYIMQFNYLW